MNRLLATSLIVGCITAPSFVVASVQQDKVNLCHKTGNDSYIVQSVNANEEQSHLDNGDFVYNGPLKYGKPDVKLGPVWCADNAPKPPVTDTTPPVIDISPPVSTPPTDTQQIVTNNTVTPSTPVDTSFSGK